MTDSDLRECRDFWAGVDFDVYDLLDELLTARARLRAAEELAEAVEAYGATPASDEAARRDARVRLWGTVRAYRNSGGGEE